MNENNSTLVEQNQQFSDRERSIEPKTKDWKILEDIERRWVMFHFDFDTAYPSSSLQQIKG